MKTIITKLILLIKSINKPSKNKIIEFTPELLRKHNFGLYIIKDKADVFRNPDYAATVAFKLGYHNTPVKKGNSVQENEVSIACNRYFLCNFLTDGWIFPIGNTDEEICKYLNGNDYSDKYRILTQSELLYIIKNRTNSKQLFHN